MMEQLRGATALVTGASGFVGGALALRLAAEGVQVRALVRSADRARRLLSQPAIELVTGDITDARRMKEVTSGCRLVFHCAAVSEGTLEEQRTVNVDGTRNVLAGAAAQGVERFVHISTLAVYGLDYPAEIDESLPLRPTPDPYTFTKAEAELVVRSGGLATDLSIVILRPGPIFGPHSDMWSGTIARHALRPAIVFLGDGSGVAPVIYIDDFLDLCVLAATSARADGQAFNASLDPAPTWREFLTAYADLDGGRRWVSVPIIPLRGAAWLISLFGRSGGLVKSAPVWLNTFDRYTRFRNRKARTMLGWQPEIDVPTGVRLTAPWLRAQGILPQLEPDSALTTS